MPDAFEERGNDPMISHADAFEMMCIRAGENNRDEKLFGGCLARAREMMLPFAVGEKYPTMYFEFPLKGDPFLDVTVLYTFREEVSIKSKYASGCEEMIRQFCRMKQDHSDICFGFEVDTSKEDPGMAAIHFQPHSHTDLVEPFCASIGEKRYAALYLEAASKLEDKHVPPSFFGMFRGRSDAPLRVCGYLGAKEKNMIINDKNTLYSMFDAVGFTAYDDAMTDEIVNILKMAPCEADYQFDIYPDGRAGEVFSLDIRLNKQTSRSVKESFENGSASVIMSHFSSLAIADERLGLISDMTTSLAFPTQDENGDISGYALLIHPMWLKIRWKNTCLQNAKCYSQLKGCFI